MHRSVWLIAAVILVVLAGAAFAKDHPPGGSTPPRAGQGVFNGISAWGNGAPGCARHETDTVLEFHCSGIKENFIGSFVLIRFPSKNFKAVVELREGGDPGMGVAWTEQDTTVLTPIVYNHGLLPSAFDGSRAVTLTGASVQFSNEWDIGLDSFKISGGFSKSVNAQITITSG